MDIFGQNTTGMMERMIMDRQSPHQLGTWLDIAEGGGDAGRLIARYLRDHYRQAAFMSAGELAAAAGVSQPSVSRFAAALGFSGYAEWNRALQSVIRLELSAADRLWYAAHADDEQVNEDRVIVDENRNLRALQGSLSSEEFSLLALRMAQARDIVIVSARASATLAPYAHYFLGKVRPGVSMVTHGDARWDRLAAEDPRDTLVFALVFPRYPRALARLLTDLRERGFPLCGLTDAPASPLCALSSTVLVAPVASASLFDSYAAPVAGLNLLIRRIAQLRGQDARDRLERLEQLDQEHDVYI